MTYESLSSVDARLFQGFSRHQAVTRCWRKENGAWVIRDIAFTEEWNDADYARLSGELTDTAQKGGRVIAAMEDRRVVGFIAVENAPLGSRGQYRQLSCMQVSAPYRGKGLGRKLFTLAADAARALGGEKLYISAHSSVESQAFYRAMGCTEAEEYDPALTAAEPCDCQMEYAL